MDSLNSVFILHFAYGLVSGAVLAFLVSIVYICRLKKENNLLKRQYDKKSLGMDGSSLKIQTLENKIKTLEIALKKQMEK